MTNTKHPAVEISPAEKKAVARTEAALKRHADAQVEQDKRDAEAHARGLAAAEAAKAKREARGYFR